MRRLSIFLPLTAIALLGFGCSKPEATPTGTTTTTPQEAQVFLPPPPAPESDSQRNMRELRDALLRFEDAKTFRAKMTLTTKDGTVSGQIDVMKPERFHGTMGSTQSNGASDKSELIGIGDMLYVRVAKDQWAYVKDPAKAKAYTTAFRASINSQASILPAVLPENTTVAKTRDNSLGCDRYSMTISDASSSAAVQVCVANGLPKRIILTPDGGSATIDYFDYNKLFVIERPVGLYQ